MKIKIFFWITLSFLVVFSSCQDESPLSPDTTTTTTAEASSDPPVIKYNYSCVDNISALIRYNLYLEEYAKLIGTTVPEDRLESEELGQAGKQLNKLRDYIRYEEIGLKIPNLPLGEIINDRRKLYNFKSIAQCIGLIAQLMPDLERIAPTFDIEDCVGSPPGDGIQTMNFLDTLKLDDFRFTILAKKEVQIPKGNFIRDRETSQEADDREDFLKVRKMLQHIFGSTYSNNTQNQEIKRNWDAIVLIVHDDSIKKNNIDGGRSVKIMSTPLQDRRIRSAKLCLNQKFRNQLSTHSYGTGFFISDSLIMTAGHNFFIDPKPSKFGTRRLYHPRRSNGPKFNKYRFILYVDEEKRAEEDGYIVPKEYVFRPKYKALRAGWYRKSYTKQDWAVVPVEPAFDEYKLDTIPSVTGVQLNGISSTEVYSIGHGLGLPKKLVFDGSLSENVPTNPFFKCNLDLFGGNSGSPVFDAQTNKVVGILVRGLSDFIKEGSCFKYTVYDSQPRVGEDVQWIDVPVQQNNSLFPNATALNTEVRDAGRSTLIAANSVVRFQDVFENADLDIVQNACNDRRGNGDRRNYAPYSYLHRSGNEYSIFVATPVNGTNKRLYFTEQDTVRDPGGQFFVTYRISDGGLSPDNLARDSFSIKLPDDTWEIVLDIEHNKEIFMNVLDPKDADDAPLSDISLETAYNRPYTYLTGLKTDTDSIQCYIPFVVVPIKGFLVDSIAEDFKMVRPNDAVNIITLNDLNASFTGLYYPPYINSQAYGAIVDGYTEVFIKIGTDGLIDLTSTIRRKKSKNKDADGKPQGY
ncbi:MAG: serine protease [Bacteroidota bacterium]